jgi:hypothetical protein
VRLARAAHTFEVRAVDAAGNADPTPASHSWSIDQAPDTTIVSGPAALSLSADATFTFSATEPGATFECALDFGAFAACSSPHTVTGLGAGPHTFTVRAVDLAGNADLTAAEYEWTVDATADTTPPDTTIVTGPADPTTFTNATFTFSAFELNMTFECALDGAAFAPCDSPQTISGLAGGPHTFAVRAVDLAGNIDPTPASYAWTVDGPPETTIDSGPADPTSSTSATFTFSSSKPGSTFECSLDLAPLAACVSPVTYTGLAVGPHEFLVRAIDASGTADLTPEDYEWTIEASTPTPTNTPTPTGSGLHDHDDHLPGRRRQLDRAEQLVQQQWD